MKIIGTVSGNVYLAEVTHEELEKAADLYYGKMNPLKVGDHHNLGEGYNFRTNIVDACRRMTEASQSFGTAQNSLLRFAQMLVDKEDQEKSE